MRTSDFSSIYLKLGVLDKDLAFEYRRLDCFADSA